LALIVIGGLVALVGSSSFVSSSADRGMSVNVTDDGSAYVGLEYPEANQERTIELHSSNSQWSCDGGWECLVEGYYEYNEVQIITIEDQSPSNQLFIQGSDNIDSSDIAQSISYDTESGSVQSVSPTFECRASGIFTRNQQEEEESFTISFEATSSADSLSIDLDREFEVVCIGD